MGRLKMPCRSASSRTAMLSSLRISWLCSGCKGMRSLMGPRSSPTPCLRDRVLVFRVEMQISRVELASFLEALPVQDAECSAPPLDEAGPPQFLERAVDVNCRKPERVAEFGLG